MSKITLLLFLLLPSLAMGQGSANVRKEVTTNKLLEDLKVGVGRTLTVEGTLAWAGSSSITTLGTITSGTIPVARVSGLGTLATQSATITDYLLSATATSTYVPKTLTVNGHALSGNISVTASDLGLGSVENTALTTWPGSTSITTLGTITTGTVPVARVSGLGTLATQSGTFSGTSSGTNTGDNAINSLYSGLVTNATHTGDATGATALTVVGINGTTLSGLATGILKNTTGTGVPSIAVAGTDYLAPGGSGAALTGITTGQITGISDYLLSATATTTYQPLDDDLTALAGLTSAADKMPYFTGSGTAATTTVTSFIRTLLDDTSTTTARATLKLTKSGVPTTAVDTAPIPFWISGGSYPKIVVTDELAIGGINSIYPNELTDLSATGINSGLLGKAYGGTAEDNSTGGTANTFWGRPNGATGEATYRAIVAADLPNIPVAGGGTGLTSLTGLAALVQTSAGGNGTADSGKVPLLSAVGGLLLGKNDVEDGNIIVARTMHGNVIATSVAGSGRGVYSELTGEASEAFHAHVTPAATGGHIGFGADMAGGTGINTFVFGVVRPGSYAWMLDELTASQHNRMTINSTGAITWYKDGTTINSGTDKTTLTYATPSGTGVVTVPAGVTGNVVTTGDTGTVTAAMIVTAPAISAANMTSFPNLNQNTTGSAATLTTTRTIGGSSFDGSANVTSFPSPGAIGGSTPATGAFTTLTGTVASSNALVIGPNGSTNPVLQVDSATASSATGIKITGAASGSGVQIGAIGGTNESLLIQSKGVSDMILNSPTGNVRLRIGGSSRLVLNEYSLLHTTLANAGAALVRHGFTGAADLTLTASTEAPSVYFDLGQTRQHSTGAITLQRDMCVKGSTHSFVGASTITDAATFSVDGPPIAGTNATITNAHGIYVPTIAVNSGGGTVTTAYGINVATPTGATNNYSALFGSPLYHSIRIDAYSGLVLQGLYTGSTSSRSSIAMSQVQGGTITLNHGGTGDGVFATSGGTNNATLGGYFITNTQSTLTIKPTKKDFNGGYTGAGHILAIEGGQASITTTGGAGGPITITGGGAGLSPTLTSGATTNASTTVTCASTTGVNAGMTITGTGIPTGTTVSSVTNSTTLVLSAAATATNTGLTFSTGNNGGSVTIGGGVATGIGAGGAVTISTRASTGALVSRLNFAADGVGTLPTSGAASAPALNVTGVPFAGTGTTSFPLVYLNETGATASTTLSTSSTTFGINANTTDGYFLDFLQDGTTKFSISKFGALNAASVGAFGAYVSAPQFIAAGSYLGNSGTWPGQFLVYHGGDTSKGATLAFPPRTPAQITSNQNNYNPLAAASETSPKYVRLSTDASRDITGLVFTVATQAGQEHVLVNVGSFDVVLKHEDTNSTTTNRFLTSTGADITLTPNQQADCWYDNTTARWRLTKRN